MKIRLTDNYYNFKVIQDNALKPRSYFIPYKEKEDALKVNLLNERSSSSLVELLNGEWDFKFYKNPNELSEEFDTNDINFDKIDVPSCIQYRGYDRHFYLNCRYQFPCKPPKIPTLKKVGKAFNIFGNGKFFQFVEPTEDEYNFICVYRKKISLDLLENKKYILSFLGVCSGFDLYVNSSYVGYAEGSHNMHEFDISSNLKQGENEICLVIHRWCNGSYLECQDMFRNNGIFRDVLLRKEEYIFDYALNYKKIGDNAYDLEVSVDLYKEGEVRVSISSLNACIKGESATKHHLKLSSLKVEEWNAEVPSTYELVIEVINEGKTKEVIRKIIGFKTVEIKEDKFYLNNELFKIKGVNHHDTSPINGYFLTPDEIKKDILLCKEFNVNTIRTSHYPSDPLLLDLCTVYGIYVIDEADLETHGCQMGTLMNFGLISNDKRWENHYLDRAVHLYERDKNNSCIIMWSLGNEAGGYKNQDKMYEYFKSVSNIPVHYESVVHSKRKAYDVGSQMYPPLEMVESVGKHNCKIKQFNDRPYVLCEYVHAMGVGPGAMKEYMELFYSYDNLMGGCIWEMVDHSWIDKNGVYRYGGDAGEFIHDGNFCVDGLFYPDRTPSNGAYIMKHEYRPFRFKYLEENKFEIFNTNSFISSEKYLIEFTINNKVISKRISLKSLSKDIIELPIDLNKENIVYINVYLDDKLVSEESIEINYLVEEKKELISKAKLIDEKLIFNNGSVYVEENNLVIEYLGDKIEYSDFGTLLFRAPTDNDLNTLGFKLYHDNLSQINKVCDVKYYEGKIEVTTHITSGKDTFLNIDNIEVSEEGVINFESILKPIKVKNDLFRFAKAFKLDKKFDTVTYFGRTRESYNDMKEHAIVKEDTRNVLEMVEPNIRPQESGNRMDCKYAKISDGEKVINFEAVIQPFELGVKPYSDVQLLSMKHRNDEVNTGTYVTISKFNRGIGTGACGPVTLNKYTYDGNIEYVLRFRINMEK